MSKKKIIIAVSALVVVAAVLLVVNIRNSGSDEIQVQTSQVGNQKIVQTVNATGRIQPQTQVNISADISAKIIELPVEEGDWVEKGQLLARLDQERFIATVERAAATKRSVESNARLARENMIKAEKDYERAKELFAKQLESQANLDQMYAAYEVEKARYQSTLDQVAQA